MTTPAPAARLNDTLVIDIGKSNAKLLVISPDGEVRAQASHANGPVAGPGYAALAVDRLRDWLLTAIPGLPGREHIGRIAIGTHGAAFCAIDDAGLVLPPIDYEWDGYGPHRGTFDAATDPFAHTGSPCLPLGLNAGLQLHWVQQARPDDWARITHWLPYPQYWAWWLSGVAASEVSSLGCHTHLWAPAEGGFSRWARRAGIAEPFAPLRKAWDVLGTLRPALAASLGLSESCEVHCGVHDSNACLARHLGPADATLLTTGTWTIAMAPGPVPPELDPSLDQLVNVAIDGRPVPTARFMGGREFEAVCAGAPIHLATGAALADVVAAGWHVTPSFAEAGGPFRGRTGQVPTDVPLALRPALAALYCAQMSWLLVNALRAHGPVVLEGPLARNAAFGCALASLLGPERPLSRSVDALEGTARGVWCLTHWPRPPGRGDPLEAIAPPEAPLAAAVRHLTGQWLSLNPLARATARA